MVKVGIVGYTPLNGHPYSFGCIINGFNKGIVIDEYPQIESYLKKNIFYEKGIEDMQCTHVFCKEKSRADHIAKIIGAASINSLEDFPDDLDIILILCDYSKWREKIISKLIRKYKLFVDKPLAKTQKELLSYKNFINEQLIMSSSMFIHNPEIKKICTKDLSNIKVTYFGTWTNYSAHAIDPLIEIISDKLPKSIKGINSNTVFIKEANIEIVFLKEKNKIPNFEYVFTYKNKKQVIVKIKSNFESFRNGLISIKDSLLNKIIYRKFNDYKMSLDIYESLKNE